MKTGRDVVFLENRPTFGEDFDVGWIGFNHAESTMAKAIAHVERWNRDHEIVVSHALVITGEDECIEAAFPKGVVRTNLTSGYFNDDSKYLVFRKPKNLTDEVAKRIVDVAEQHVGDDFNHEALANHALQDNFFGWLVNSACSGQLRDCVDRFISGDNEWICSELAAYCLDQQPEYQGKGVLSRSHGALTPQQLFDDDELFEPLPGSRED